MVKNQFTRRELYDLIWTQHIADIAKNINIKESELKKTCKKMDIPLPYMGYWAKIKSGKSAHRILFDENFIGKDEIIFSPKQEVEKIENPIISDFSIRKKEVETDKRINLKPPLKLTNPDPLIVKYKEYLELRNKHSNNYSFSYGNHLDIRVTSKQLQRAILIMDTLIKAIKARGHDVHIDNCNSTIMVINGENYEFYIREKTNKIKIENTEYKWLNEYTLEPTNILVIRCKGYSGREWYDNKIPLENKLSNIIAFIELKTEELHAIWEQHRKIREEKARLIKIEEDHKLRIQEEVDKFKSLLNDSKRWKNLLILREYLNHIQNNIKNTNQHSPYSTEWLEWANAKADWYDPEKNYFDELLDGIDKNSF